MDNLTEKYQSFLQPFLPFRPKPERNFDQFYCNLETVVKRVQILSGISDFEKKEVLFLGDDDLTSIALSYLFRPKKTVVIDLDSKIIGFLKLISDRANLGIEFFQHDLRNPLPKTITRDFSLLFFDPAYTPFALNIWLQRALELSLGSGANKARKNPARLSQIDIFSCYGYTQNELERGLKVQEVLTNMGFVIQEKWRDFNSYETKNSLSEKSDLYHLKPTPKINLVQMDSLKSRFYTGERSSSNHFSASRAAIQPNPAAVTACL